MTQAATEHTDDVSQDESKVEVIRDPALIRAINKSELEILFAQAEARPRSIKRFKAKAIEMATLDQETAESMFYVVPRSGKKISGPSVRLAEVCAIAWTNLRNAARVIDEGDKFITAQGVSLDFESRTFWSVETKRRITDKYGKRYGDDMIGVTSNAACSIALRQAVFRNVPMAYVRQVYHAARKAAAGEGTMEERRKRTLDWWVEQGAKPADVYAAVGKAGVDDLTLDDIIDLRGMCNAILDGELTLEQALRPKDTTDTEATIRRSSLLDE